MYDEAKLAKAAATAKSLNSMEGGTFDDTFDPSIYEEMGDADDTTFDPSARRQAFTEADC